MREEWSEIFEAQVMGAFLDLQREARGYTLDEFGTVEEYFREIETSLKLARESERMGGDYARDLANAVLQILDLCEADDKDLSEEILNKLGQAQRAA